MHSHCVVIALGREPRGSRKVAEMAAVSGSRDATSGSSREPPINTLVLTLRQHLATQVHYMSTTDLEIVCA